MTVYVFRGGALHPKEEVERAAHNRTRSTFPAPMLSRMEPFESPVTGKEISSWRERDKDMAAAGAVDPRDLPAPTRGRASKPKEAKNGKDRNFKWGSSDPRA